MIFLRALISTARMIRHTSGLADGLSPDEDVFLDAPDNRLAPALAAAGRGDHRPAAALLAATREAAEWESRDRYVMRLAGFARSRPGWFADWLSTSPRDPDAVLLQAELAVRTAWERPGREVGVPPPKTGGPLRETAPLIAAAAEAAPRDPVPWRIALDHARGTHAPRSDFDTLWAEAVRRSPHHYGCHVAALRWLGHLSSPLSADGCPVAADDPLDRPRPAAAGAASPGAIRDPYGECFDFAERAAGQALPGSLLQALPVRAALAVLGGDSVGDPAAGLSEMPRRVSGAPRRVSHALATGPHDDRIHAAADLAVSLSARYEPGDPWPAEIRNLLAYVLIVLGRWSEALEQFRLIGPHATAFPWTLLSDDPLGQFLELRDGVRIQLASTMPLWQRSGRAPAGGH
ncbi:hypothetical protein [Streptomyces sp. KR80]|uniref:hypothetical protein n=1 Tax=Streptomyces sp. KR80 TaxID=3457426 RepID=UPI003FD3791B